MVQGRTYSPRQPHHDHSRRAYGIRLRRRALPTMSLFRENAIEGCLMAYGPAIVEAYRIAGHLVGRVLRGSRPAEIPIERPTRFELIINLKTPKALGLPIPQSVLAPPHHVLASPL